MSIIKHIVEEELERLEKLSAKYKAEIKNLPKGSISKKSRHGRFYVYLAYRENKKIRFKYIGKESSEEAKALEQKIQKRKKYENLLKQLENDLKEVRRTKSGKKV